MTEKGCDNCYYTYFDEKAYPCSLCIRGIERTDQWQPSKKTKADRKDEPQNDCEGCKHYVYQLGCTHHANCEYEPKDEPQYDAEEVAKDINHRVDMVKKEWNARHIEDEPQTDCSWK